GSPNDQVVREVVGIAAAPVRIVDHQHAHPSSVVRSPTIEARGHDVGPRVGREDDRHDCRLRGANESCQPTLCRILSIIRSDRNRISNMLFATPELSAAELKVVAEVEDLKKKLRWQLHEPRRWLGSLRRVSMARAIQGSNSIEGFD